MRDIPQRESLTVEFKSDRTNLPNADLAAAIVGLANTEGGELWLGVEDNGTVTGLFKPEKGEEQIKGSIATNTNPTLMPSVEILTIRGLRVARIVVQKSRTEVCTQRGLYLRRRLKADGTPENIPMTSEDRTIRAGKMGIFDLSAQPVHGATLEDFDPLERIRLRQTIQVYGKDKVLLELEDEELEGALGLTCEENGMRVPTVTGMLLIGKEISLRRFIPGHEFAFQVFDGDAILFNEFFRTPLLKSLERLQEIFIPYNPEEEIQIGLLRVAAPRVDKEVFRESVLNALIHRDYSISNAVYIQLKDDEFVISNPGGFVEGVTIENILNVQPHPRNRTLADAMYRIGFVDRVGRGVDKIYRGVLRFGRSKPDYGRTTSTDVVLSISTDKADLNFLKFIVSVESRQSKDIPVNSLLVLSAIREERRCTTSRLVDVLHWEVGKVKKELEHLVEKGLIEAQGKGRGRSYILSAAVYEATGNTLGYIRQSGFSDIQHEEMIKNLLKKKGQIRRAEVIALCQMTPSQATAILKKLRKKGILVQHGERKGAFYTSP